MNIKCIFNHVQLHQLNCIFKYLITLPFILCKICEQAKINERSDIYKKKFPKNEVQLINAIRCYS